MDMEIAISDSFLRKKTIEHADYCFNQAIRTCIVSFDCRTVRLVENFIISDLFLEVLEMTQMLANSIFELILIRYIL